MKLYEISEQYHIALSELQESGLPEQAIADTLEGLKGDIEVKAKQVAAFIANRQAEIDAVKEASKKLAERAKTEQANVDGLINYLKYNMEASGITEIRSTELVLKIKKNPHSLIVDNEDSAPIEYKKLIPERYELDKAKVKKALKDGEEITWAHLEQKTRLEIK